MSNIVIKTEGLGKKYLIGHEATREPYTALRDVISRSARNLLRKANDMFHGRPIVEGDELEEIWALRGVNIEVRRGEVLGIIGRNGAGKSTLLKILSRITEPSEGKVSIRGRVASLLEVGTGFHPELSGRENIFLNGAILGMSRKEIVSKLDEIVAFAEVERYLDTPVKRYSSGMYVRLAFAVAAHLEPEILIVDEVLSVGDAQFQKKCLGKIGQVAGRNGRTVLFVSHNMAAVKSLCSRVILLQGGSVNEEGDAVTVANHYLSSGEHSQWEVCWPDPSNAPGDGTARLISVSAVPEGLRDGAPADVTTPIQIHVDYFNSIPDHRLNVSLLLYTQDNICVLNTVSKSISHAPGRHRATCHIPGRILNDETYRVRILLIRDRSKALLDADNVIAFDLKDADRGGAWYGNG